MRKLPLPYLLVALTSLLILPPCCYIYLPVDIPHQYAMRYVTHIVLLLCVVNY